MDRVTLGRTGLDVSRLSLGGLFVMSAFAEQDEAQRIVERALHLGINYIDTAPGYGDSEQVLGKILPSIEAPFILSTKLGERSNEDPLAAQDASAIRDCFRRSLDLLNRESVDILIIHEPDRPGQTDWWTDMMNVEGPVLDVLDELKAEGLIKHTGIGGTTAASLAHLCRSGKFDVVLTAFNYSLLWREAENDVIPSAKAAGMGIIVGSPLQQGALAARYDEQLDHPGSYWLSAERKAQFRALYALLDEVDIPLPELATRFVLSNPDVHTVLSGARSVAQIEANVASAEKGGLPTDLLSRLDEIGAMVPFRPSDEPMGLGWHMGSPERFKGPGRGA